MSLKTQEVYIPQQSVSEVETFNIRVGDIVSFTKRYADRKKEMVEIPLVCVVSQTPEQTEYSVLKETKNGFDVITRPLLPAFHLHALRADDGSYYPTQILSKQADWDQISHIRSA